MLQIKLDAAQVKLLSSHDLVELCDPSGNVMGKFLPRFDRSKWEIVGEEPSDEELDRRANSNQRRYTTSEVLSQLRSLATP